MKIIYLDTVDSTMNYIKNHQNKQDMLVVIANEQTAGMGRKNRYFVSNKEQGIYLSVLLLNRFSINDINNVTAISSVGVVKAFNDLYGVKLDVKWLNDIFYLGKKLGGILVHTKLIANEVNFSEVVIGIGINVGEIDDSIKDIAISTKDIVNNFNKEEFIEKFLEVFEVLLDANNEKVYKMYCEHLILGNVIVSGNGFEYEAKIIDVNEHYNLIVEDLKGVVHILNTEEVSVKGISDES